MLDGRPGEHVTLTEVRTRTPRHAPNPRVAEVLADLGLLDDDTTLAVRSWIDRRTGELRADRRTGPAALGPGLQPVAHTTASRYAAIAQHLLDDQLEQPTER